jgi:hypothetical protein
MRAVDFREFFPNWYFSRGFLCTYTRIINIARCISEAAMDGAGARPVFRVSEPKKLVRVARPYKKRHKFVDHISPNYLHFKSSHPLLGTPLGPCVCLGIFFSL